jgi:hypothetical protein
LNEKAKEAEDTRKQQQFIVESRGNVAVGHLTDLLKEQKLDGGDGTLKEQMSRAEEGGWVMTDL